MDFVASRTFLTALAMNDAILASGSIWGIVKLWDLKELLGKSGCAHLVSPLRCISMNALTLPCPIKQIDLLSYLDVVIVAKYLCMNKKDKIKVVRILRRWS